MLTKKPVTHLLQDRASADRRSHLAAILTKLRRKPVNVL